VEARGREGIKDKGRGKGEKGRGSATSPPTNVIEALTPLITILRYFFGDAR